MRRLLFWIAIFLPPLGAFLYFVALADSPPFKRNVRSDQARDGDDWYCRLAIIEAFNSRGVPSLITTGTHRLRRRRCGCTRPVRCLFADATMAIAFRRCDYRKILFTLPFGLVRADRHLV